METPVLPSAELEETEAPAASPTLDPQQVELYLHRLRMDQNLVKAILAGALAAIAGAAVWAAITVATDYQIGYMAIGVGILVGYAIRRTGHGMDKVFGIVGATLALFGCVLGNFLSVIGFISLELGLSYFEALFSLDYSFVPELMAETFSPIDLLFYALAVYRGYKMSFRVITEEELIANASIAPATAYN